MTITGPELVGIALTLLLFAGIVTPFALFGDRWIERLKSDDR